MKKFFTKRYVILALSLIALLVGALYKPEKHHRSDQKQALFDKDHSKQHFKNYLLALSWSPTYCLERDPQGNQPQCDLSASKQYRFIVHGLWPQSGTRKFLEYCKTGISQEFSQNSVSDYFYLMPSYGLMAHEWKKHGACSGLDQKTYFQTIETLYQQFEIQDWFFDMKKTQQTSLNKIKQMVKSTIPQLDDDQFVIKCRRQKLSEIRICLNKDLSLRECTSYELKAGGCSGNQMITIPLR